VVIFQSEPDGLGLALPGEGLELPGRNAGRGITCFLSNRLFSAIQADPKETNEDVARVSKPDRHWKARRRETGRGER
jgi:hypothetical protein